MSWPCAAESVDDSLRRYAVHVGDLYGIYLGKGAIITAAHVVNSSSPVVTVSRLRLQAKVLKTSPFEQLDLSLLLIDEEQLPVSLRMRRLPLCESRPATGSKVIVVIPEGIAYSQILPPSVLPANVRARFATAIAHVKSTGNSGSGVFDAEKRCLLGIMSRKITQNSPSGESSMDIAKYFVPSVTVRQFIPSEYRP